MVDRFFFESLGVSYDSLVRTIQNSWKGPNSPPLSPMERIIYKARPSFALRVRRLIFSLICQQLIAPHIRAQWLNPPRRRRHLAKSMANWHALYSILCEIVAQVDRTVRWYHLLS